jgi:hypothetical protein
MNVVVSYKMGSGVGVSCITDFFMKEMDMDHDECCCLLQNGFRSSEFHVSQIFS